MLTGTDAPRPRTPGSLLRRGAALAAAAALAVSGPARAAEVTVPGELRVDVTRECAGFEWRIVGDDDRDCRVALSYRALGSGGWRPAQPLLRVHGGLWTHGEDPGNLLAGSLFHLAPDTDYEARLALADPDGGSDERVVGFRTRAIPRSADLRVLRVIPGGGGGTGTIADPFRGLATADLAARPGDTFLLWPGTYAGEFAPTRDGTPGLPIVYRGVDPELVVLDGAGGGVAARLDGRHDLHLEGMRVVNAWNPVRADGARDVVIRGCTIEPLAETLGIVGLRAAAAHGLSIEDNTVRMNGAWETVGRTGAYGLGGYGILIEGSDHVIAHNTVIEAWDAISLPVSDGAVPALVTRNVDVIGNFVDRASDDGIQADALHHNIRILGNRLLNTGSAVSFQPLYGGPGYVIGNEMFNNRIEPFKFHQETFFGWTQETSGFLVYHNTSFASRNAWYETGLWSDGRFRNNLLLGARLDQPSFVSAAMPGADLDHDGWNRAGSTPTLIRYGSGNHATLAAFAAATGHEAHGVEVTPAVFANAPPPHHPEWEFFLTPYGAPYAATAIDLSLVAGSAAIDRGVVLDNINDAFAGAAPDLGCREHGLPAPHYGASVPPRLVGADAQPPGTPLTLALSPNPFASTLRIQLELAAAGPVRVVIHDIRGARVRTLAAEARASGPHALHWDGRGADGSLQPAGVYFVRVEAGGRTLGRRIVRTR